MKTIVTTVLLRPPFRRHLTTSGAIIVLPSGVASAAISAASHNQLRTLPGEVQVASAAISAASHNNRK